MPIMEHLKGEEAIAHFNSEPALQLSGAILEPKLFLTTSPLPGDQTSAGANSCERNSLTCSSLLIRL